MNTNKKNIPASIRDRLLNKSKELKRPFLEKPLVKTPGLMGCSATTFPSTRKMLRLTRDRA